MTLRRSGVDYATHAWNPVTGCFHPCRDVYCYAARDVKHYTPKTYVPSPGAVHLLDDPVRNDEGHKVPWPFGFEPTVHRYRFNDPLNQPAPARVFVCDYGDLFGVWVPRQDIQAVLNTIAQRPDLVFLLLTKNPSRYAAFQLPDNAWPGTTATSEDDIGRVHQLMTSTLWHRWVSYEPMLGGFDDHSWMGHISWLVMGAQTGRRAVEPYRDWVEDAVGYAGNHCVPVFIKDNLRPYAEQWCLPVTRDYPTGMVIG